MDLPWVFLWRIWFGGEVIASICYQLTSMGGKDVEMKLAAQALPMTCHFKACKWEAPVSPLPWLQSYKYSVEDCKSTGDFLTSRWKTTKNEIKSNENPFYQKPFFFSSSMKVNLCWVYWKLLKLYLKQSKQAVEKLVLTEVSYINPFWIKLKCYRKLGPY